MTNDEILNEISRKNADDRFAIKQAIRIWDLGALDESSTGSLDFEDPVPIDLPIYDQTEPETGTLLLGSPLGISGARRQGWRTMVVTLAAKARLAQILLASLAVDEAAGRIPPTPAPLQ